LHIANFTWPGGAREIPPGLAAIARRADQGGIDRISVMDHLWQIDHVGPAEHEMLEAYTTLGWLAAKTERLRLITMVTAVVYRNPGLLAKMVTTLDVLSGGRAMLGIGAAWNEEEARGLGLPFPPVVERFERLEEAVRICLQMWAGEQHAFDGTYYKLARPLNSPQPLSRPHPPLLIGGDGEKKTLRMVAQYADACNISDTPDLWYKLEVLRDHCERLGRDYDAIEKTVQTRFDLGDKGNKVDALIEYLRDLSELGIDVAHGELTGVNDPRQLDLLCERVVPAVHDFG
jgi:F420-dependent oxidoreductase-like protein